MNSAKYIEIFKNGQKEGIRDVTVKRKLQTVRKFLSYLRQMICRTLIERMFMSL